MCKCIAKWVPDPDSSGTHNLVPVTCEQIIEELLAHPVIAVLDGDELHPA